MAIALIVAELTPATSRKTRLSGAADDASCSIGPALTATAATRT
jgi:hypothetical protein